MIVCDDCHSLPLPRNHGGLLWSVVPEALLDWCDYRQWLSDVGGKGSVGFQPGGEEEFNDLSNQAWTHLLMQIVKVCFVCFLKT